MSNEYNICPICNREMVMGHSSVNQHHLIPKSLGGTETISMHRICHHKIHSLFTERELKNSYFTVESIVSHSEIVKFIKWVQKKPAKFYDRNDPAMLKLR
jgi:hypothetical protein